LHAGLVPQSGVVAGEVGFVRKFVVAAAYKFVVGCCSPDIVLVVGVKVVEGRTAVASTAVEFHIVVVGVGTFAVEFVAGRKSTFALALEAAVVELSAAIQAKAMKVVRAIGKTRLHRVA